MTSQDSDIPVETHPWGDFIPPNTRVALMGTFPPTSNKWCMEFFYPNRSNDFWRIFGLIFFGDAQALYNPQARNFRVDDIKKLLSDKGIAIATTAVKVRRLQGNAADKHLEIVQTVDLPALLKRMPHCRAIGTTGEKAASVIASLTHTPIPRIGQPIQLPDGIALWRMPSTSRAYPLALERKAAYYAELFRSVGIDGIYLSAK